MFLESSFSLRSTLLEVLIKDQEEYTTTYRLSFLDIEHCPNHCRYLYLILNSSICLSNSGSHNWEILH